MSLSDSYALYLATDEEIMEVRNLHWRLSIMIRRCKMAILDIIPTISENQD